MATSNITPLVTMRPKLIIGKSGIIGFVRTSNGLPKTNGQKIIGSKVRAKYSDKVYLETPSK